MPLPSEVHRCGECIKFFLDHNAEQGLLTLDVLDEGEGKRQCNGLSKGTIASEASICINPTQFYSKQTE